MSSQDQEARKSSRAAPAPPGVRALPDATLGDVVLPLHAAPDRLASLLDDAIAAMTVVPADEAVGVLRSAPPLGWGTWVARQIKLGNLEIRVSRGHLYSQVPDADEIDWVPGEYLAGSFAFTGKGIVILDPLCREDPKLIEHEGIHYFDEGFEIATGRRISGVETELHAFFRGEVFELRCARFDQGRAPWLWPRKLKQIRGQLRRKIVLDGYYGVTSDISLVENAEEEWLPAYARSKLFPLRGRIDAEVARRILGLDQAMESRFPDGLRRAPTAGLGIDEAARVAVLAGRPVFRPYDQADLRRVWRTRIERYLGKLCRAGASNDRWPGLDAFPEDERQRSNWGARPSSPSELLDRLIESSKGSEGVRLTALGAAEECLQSADDQEVVARLRAMMAKIDAVG